MFIPDDLRNFLRDTFSFRTDHIGAKVLSETEILSKAPLILWTRVRADINIQNI